MPRIEWATKRFVLYLGLPKMRTIGSSSPLARASGRSVNPWTGLLLATVVCLFFTQRMLISYAPTGIPESTTVTTSDQSGNTDDGFTDGVFDKGERLTITNGEPEPEDSKVEKTSESSSMISSRRMDAESKMLLETALDDSQTIHITHFFSTFSVPATSASYVEQMIVQESWKRAAIEAKRKRGLNIQFIDNTLPGDDACSPPYAQRFDMTWWLKDVKKGKVPTVGENFHIAKQKGRGELMMFSNADIGVLPDFYVRAWDWAHKDFRTPRVQLEAMRYTAKFIASCFFQLGIFGKMVPAMHLETCAEDARVFYIHAGGFKDLWEEVKLDIAMYGARIHRNAKVAEVTLPRVEEMIQLMTAGGEKVQSARVEEISNMLATAPDWRTVVENFEMKVPSEERLSRIPRPLFAGTVTRIDTDVVINTTLPEWRERPERLYEEMMPSIGRLGVRHPGNDCFLFHRDNLPEAVRLMGHPAGVRPFGLWLALSWWDSPNPYRRISATKKDPWTFHVGIGLWGMDSIPWKERASQDPSYTLFLAANYDRMSHGGFKRMLSGPQVCQNSTTPWRSPRFCNSVSNEFCAGIVRFACYYNFHYFLRDSIWYYETCQHLYTTQQGRAQSPICEFCNFLFKSRPPGSKKRFMCDPGKLKYCKGLPDEICPDGEGE